MLQLTADDRYLVASVSIDGKEFLGPKLWLVTAPNTAPSLAEQPKS